MKLSAEDPGYVPIWPSQYMLDTEGGEVQILAQKGRVVAQVGEEVAMGGGVVGLQEDLVDAHTARELRERCRGGGYWVVTAGTVEMPSGTEDH